MKTEVEASVVQAYKTMSKITLESISQTLKEEGWQVLSTEYKNLDTEMEFLCAEGHKVFAPWKKIRTRRECPVCKQNTLKINKPILVEKKKGENRVLALDQATYNTGWSVFDGNNLVRYGVYNSSSEDEVKRFNDVKVWLTCMIENWKPDIVAIEGIQYQQNFGVTTFQTLARLQGVLLDLCYELGIPCKVCPTNTWRAHCGVKGKQRNDKKRSMQLLVKQWFDISVTDDESDAIGIGKYAADAFRKQNEIVNWE